ncbi:fdxN element excision controlling factor protein [Tolypothrix sp. NIES-4075]|nr:fdxN element excision controlling factor protein [Tolypothrix sp. NIES-4075]
MLFYRCYNTGSGGHWQNMSAKDRFHDAVKTALEKDGWTITDDPLTIRISSRTKLYIDLGAEKIIAAQRDQRKIAVEVKSFLSASTMAEFHTAVGQYINYRYALADFGYEQTLYLAVPFYIYDDFFTQPFV